MNTHLFSPLWKVLSHRITLLVLFFVAVGTAGFVSWQYFQVRQQMNSLAQSQKDAQEHTKKLVESVGKLMELPADEVPTIASVTDKEKLKDQKFFANAENGDQVLIFTQSQRAILFRPSTGKIVDVTTINVQADAKPTARTTPSATPTATTTPEAELKATVAIYNGTTTEGATVTIAEKLKNAPVKAAVLVRSKAAKSDYAKTIVVDMTGKNAGAAQKLAEFLNGEVGPLPAGELTPSTDLNIIVGASSLQ